MKYATALLGASALAAGANSVEAKKLKLSWADCSATLSKTYTGRVGAGLADKGRIDSVTFSDPEPTVGDDFTIHFAGTADENFSMAQATGDLQINGQSAYSFSSDFCTQSTTKFPMGIGSVDIDGSANCKSDHILGLTSTLHLGKMAEYLIQPGTLKFTATEGDASKSELFCVNINFDVEDDPTPNEGALVVSSQQQQEEKHDEAMKLFVKALLKQRVPEVGSTVSFAYTSCKAAGDKAEVTGITFDGDQLGKPIVGTMAMTSTETIPAGTKYSLSLSAMGVTILSHTDDWCSATELDLPLGLGSIATSGLNCPAAAGALTTKVTVNLAETVRFPKSVMHIEATDASGARLICVDIDTTISGPKQPVLYI